MFKTIIEINEDIVNVQKLFLADDFEAKTSKVTSEIKNNKLLITIISEDVVSLRATLNGITTMLSIYFKTKKLSKNGK
jgi:tRNA threonylcarbamoyladenosine modification (KEOPS) complex  Pcc1 subunit